MPCMVGLGTCPVEVGDDGTLRSRPSVLFAILFFGTEHHVDAAVLLPQPLALALCIASARSGRCRESARWPVYGAPSRLAWSRRSGGELAR